MFAMISNVFIGVFTSVSDAYFKCFICLDTYMLQVLHLDVTKVNRLVHLSPRLLLSRLGISSSPFVALHTYRIAEGHGRGRWRRRGGDGCADMSARSPLLSVTWAW
jgi:hypothetical protein